MELAPVSKVETQNHAHIHSPQGIGLDHDAPESQRRLHIATPRRISSPHDDAGGVGRGVGVSEVHDIQPVPPQSPGRRPGDAGPGGSIEDFDDHPAIRRRHRVGVAARVLPLRRHEKHRCHSDRRRAGAGDQDPLEELSARLFQKRTVGSRMGQREATRWASRSEATSFSTPLGSVE